MPFALKQSLKAAYFSTERCADFMKATLDSPSWENMVIDFAQKIKNRLPDSIALHSLKLQETETSFAEWHQSDN